MTVAEPALSWESIVTAHSALVHRLAYRLTGDPHDAEDLTQDVFCKVFRSLHTYRPGTFEGWLHRITTNLFLDGVRRRARAPVHPLSEESANRLPARDSTPEQLLDERRFEPDIEAALLALTPVNRAAVVLSDVEGLPYEQVAEVLGIKTGTVRSRIHRGRAQLKQYLHHRACERT
ncbi:sigma-70 family RNA polymerase sigma factor [Nonomuraea sp. NPDC050394]|uniref:sigma-70 family RNA polymerase sigma factor n=1 Tax=Nonomuraea sp. NPDC050394 TaxID=3364363 RepID=UPI00379AB32C